MSIKTNELQQLPSVLGTDSLLADTAAAGTGRLSLSSLAQFLTEQDNAVKTALSNKVSKTTRSDIYVTKTGNDETGDGSETAPYLTIQKAVNSIGYILDLPVVLHIGAGTYDETVVIGLILGCRITIDCAQNEDGTPAVRVASVEIFLCNSAISITNMEFYGKNANYSAIYITHSGPLVLTNAVCETVDADRDRGAVYASYNNRVYLRRCTISNQVCAVHAMGTTVYLDAGTTGEHNTVSLRAGSGWGSCGATIIKGRSTIVGATEVKEYGGQIF